MSKRFLGAFLTLALLAPAEVVGASACSPAGAAPQSTSGRGVATQRPATQRPATDAPQSRTCCRVCTTGKACGDSCIARNLNCNKGAGCACDAR